MFIYLDNNILITLETFSEHIGHVKKMLLMLRTQKIECLRFVLSSEDVCAKNMGAIKQFPR